MTVMAPSASVETFELIAMPPAAKPLRLNGGSIWRGDPQHSEHPAGYVTLGKGSSRVARAMTAAGCLVGPRFEPFRAPVG